MRIIFTVIAIFLSLVLFTAFEKKTPKSQDDLMKEYIDAKLDGVRTMEWKKCFENTIKDAEQYVDSIIYRQVNFNIGDSLKAPGKPFKPGKPYDTLKLDTTPIVPILRKED